MLAATMRSHLASLRNKPILPSRSFSTTPAHDKRINLVDAFHGRLNCGETPEFVTSQGPRSISKYHADRVAASLKEKDAHNCSLVFSSDHMEMLPILKNDSWETQTNQAMEIIESEQTLALIRAGILGAWLPILHAIPGDPSIIGIWFRLPSKEDPKDFETRLRRAGVTGGKLVVAPRKLDAFWERFVELKKAAVEFTPEGEFREV